MPEKQANDSLLFCISDPNSIKLGKVDDSLAYFKLSAKFHGDKLSENMFGDPVDLQVMLQVLGKRKTFKYNMYKDDLVKEQLYS